MRFLLACLLLVHCLAAASAARAATPEPEKAAKRACLAGDYVTGVRILADLFVETNEATYLFNQGRCYEQNARYDEAIGRFNEYLRKAQNATAAERADTEAHVAACEAALARSAARTGALTTVAAPAASPPRPWQSSAAVVAAVVAVLALGFGIVEHVRYAGKGNDFNALVAQGQCNDAAPDKGGAHCASLADAQDTAAVFAGVGYATAAVAAGAAAFFWLSQPTSPPSTAVGQRLVCAPGWATLTCGGRF